MINLAYPTHGWSTASNGLGADTLPGELEALGEHLGSCQSKHRHLLSLRCAAQKMGGFMAVRFVTSVVVTTVFLGVNIWLF
jgi:hypothetical protein